MILSLRNLAFFIFSALPFFSFSQTIKTIGTGTGYTTSQPIYTFSNYSASEMIYTAAEIGITGTIVNLAFDKASGASTEQPSGIFIYMRMTSVANYGTSTAKFTTSLSGYTLVWSGNFPNSASGWQDVALNVPFDYNDNTKNLQVLVINNRGNIISSGRPQYRYTTSATSFRYNGNYSSDPTPWSATAQLTPVLERANVRLTFSSCPTGNTLYVDSSIAVSGKGDSWGTPIKELRDALSIANSCTGISKILIAKGTYKPTSNTNRDSAFTISRTNLKLYGGYASGGTSRNVTLYPTILSGDIGVVNDISDNSYHVVMVAGVANNGDSVIVDGLRIRNGNANGTGTKVYNGTTTAQNAGGGVHVSGNNLPVVKIVFRTCIISGNTAVNAGGMFVNAYSPEISNCIFSGNKATGNGGALYNEANANSSIINCTIASNNAATGGGIYNTNSSPLIANSIIWNNAGVPASIYYNVGDTLISYSIMEGTLLKGASNLVADPLLQNAVAASAAPSVAGEYGLQSCSPAFNGGSTGLLPATILVDINNQPRTAYSIIDMGAYEIQSADLTKSTWRGITSNWSDAMNWCYRNIPSSTSDVTIPAGVSFYPVLEAGNVGEVRNILIASGAQVIIEENAVLVATGNVLNEGLLTANGKIKLAGSTQQTFPGPGGFAAPQELKVLEIANTGSGVLLDRSITIQDSIIPVSGKLHLSDFDVTLHSNATGTASIAASGNATGFTYGNGRFIIERFINIGVPSATVHGKSWQFLSAPVQGAEDNTAATIRETWQENGSPVAGYGVNITDPTYDATNGFDAYSIGTSIKTYSVATNNWSALPSATGTKRSLGNRMGYMLYVRGDRSVTANGPEATSPVTLRAKGKVYDATMLPQSIVTNSAEHFESVGNPYPSAIDFEKLYQKSPGIDPVYYAWDPSLVGSYNAGGYQTMAAATGYIATPGGGKIYYQQGMAQRNIQSGQAFFVRTSSSGNATINFDEQVKTSGSQLVHRGENEVDGSSVAMLSTLLYTSAGELADGNRVVFDDQYSGAVDGDDALKIANGGENFSLLRQTKKLSVEARGHLQNTDTLFYNTSNLKTGNYTIVIAVQHMPVTSSLAFFEDAYLQTSIPVYFTDSIFVPVTITSASGSMAADRFRLVFKPGAILPVNITSIAAKRKDNNTVEVKWNVQQEMNVKQYVIERSIDGSVFNSI